MEEFDNELDKKFKFDFTSPESSQIEIKKLKKFLEKDKQATLIFYGGEPLLEIEKIKQIIDSINVPFRMQTNGILLDKLPPNYTNKITKILISIDGDKERTDYNRGKDTYNKVIQNIAYIKKNNYKGEIIARLTLSEFPDIYEQIKFLINTNMFTSYHWQIDAGFFKFDYNKEKFEEFTKEYNNSISKLIIYWLEQMRKGNVIIIYPFIAIIDSLLKKESTKLRCGAGYAGYAISTDGKVVACPIMNCIEDFKAGNLDSNPNELKKFDIGGNCLKCNYLNLCGGRCLYWNKAELWPKQGDELICKTIKHLIDELKSQLPEIQELIKNNTIKQSDFEYEKYFGPEIIP
jgi:putative peptide-modifying radical SAM enzyme